MLEVTVPVNAKATVYAPVGDGQKVAVNGADIDEAKGVEFLEREPGVAIHEVGSGEYSFVSE